jgi:uncharacterized protein Yka (UPF0111/DUF47 family)
LSNTSVIHPVYRTVLVAAFDTILQRPELFYSSLSAGADGKPGAGSTADGTINPAHRILSSKGPIMGFNLLDLLLPREVKFFTYINKLSDILHQGCVHFRDLIKIIDKLSDQEIRTRLATIKDFEQQGDKIERTVFDELNATFITPLDREDIHSIVMNIDKALDILNNISRKIEIYNIRTVPANVGKFTDIIVTIAHQLCILVTHLSTKGDIMELTRQIHQLENDADSLFHASIAELFNNKTDPTEIIKFKDIYEHLEFIVDSVDYVSKLIRGIKMKQG